MATWRNWRGARRSGSLGRNLVQRLLKHRHRLAARDQMAIVDDDGRHRPDALAGVEGHALAHLRGELVAVQNGAGPRHLERTLLFQTLASELPVGGFDRPHRRGVGRLTAAATYDANCMGLN